MALTRMISRRFPGLLLAGLLGSLGFSALAQPAPALRTFAASQPIADRYIVVFKPQVAQPAAEAARLMAAAGAGAQLHHVYGTAMKGFAATLPPAALAALQRNPQVDFIEADQTVRVNVSQLEATWGLDRIDQIDRPLDTLYQYSRTGAGVHAFIVDTGIRSDHTEFTGRLRPGYTSINDGRGTEDCDGHGTHVAGTVGGTRWGVAKQVSLVPVRVLDCAGSGSWSGVIAGIDWVAASNLRPAVANLSLGGGKSASVNAAVAGAVARNVAMVVAGGNSGADACNYSPASELSAITVGATTSGDVRASYSNFGKCLDIFAPGSSITSAWFTSATASSTISGTSMASPHVAGIAALVLQGAPQASPAAVAQAIIGLAGVNKVGTAGTGSPNLLAFSPPDGAITVTEPVIQPVSIATLQGSWVLSGKSGWRARVRVTLKNLNDPAVPVRGATVSGSFSPGGVASCVTDTTGGCTLESATIKLNIYQSNFTASGVSGAGLVYDRSGPVAVTVIR